MKSSFEKGFPFPGREENEPAKSERAMMKFRVRFKHALSRCVRKGFSVEECFGLIWEETLEGIELAEASQSDLYNELILWARDWSNPKALSALSPAWLSDLPRGAPAKQQQPFRASHL